MEVPTGVVSTWAPGNTVLIHPPVQGVWVHFTVSWVSRIHDPAVTIQHSPVLILRMVSSTNIKSLKKLHHKVTWNKCHSGSLFSYLNVLSFLSWSRIGSQQQLNQKKTTVLRNKKKILIPAKAVPGCDCGERLGINGTSASQVTSHCICWATQWLIRQPSDVVLLQYRRTAYMSNTMMNSSHLSPVAHETSFLQIATDCLHRFPIFITYF